MTIINNTTPIQDQIASASFHAFSAPILSDVEGIEVEDSKLILGQYPSESPFYVSTMNSTYFVLSYADILNTVQSNFNGIGELVSVSTFKAKRQLMAMVNLGEVEIAGQKEQIILLVKSSLDGSWALEFQVCIFRMICGNGMIIPLVNFGSSKVKHTKFAGMRVDDAYQVALAANKAAQEYKSQRESMDLVKVAMADIFPLVVGLVNARSTRSLNAARAIAELAAVGAGNDGTSIDSVVNGITDFYSHDGAHKDNEEKRLFSSVAGSAANHKANLFNRIIKVVEADKVRSIVTAGQSIIKDIA